MIPRKVKEWLICFSIVNLMLGQLLFKNSKKFNGSCSLSKAAKMSSTKIKFVNIILIYPLRLVKPMKILARTGAKGEAMTTPSI